MDPQFATLLQEIVQLQLVSIGINATALVAIMAGLLLLGLQVRRGFQEGRDSAERIAQMTAQVWREIREP